MIRSSTAASLVVFATLLVTGACSSEDSSVNGSDGTGDVSDVSQANSDTRATPLDALAIDGEALTDVTPDVEAPDTQPDADSQEIPETYQDVVPVDVAVDDDVVDPVDAGDIGPPQYDDLVIGTCESLVAPWQLQGSDSLHAAWLWSGPNYGLFESMTADMFEFLDPACPEVWETTFAEDPWSKTTVLDAGDGCLTLLGASFAGKATIVAGSYGDSVYDFNGFQFVHDTGQGAMLLRADGTFTAVATVATGEFEMNIDMHYQVRRSGMFSPEPNQPNDGDFYLDVRDYSKKTERTRSGYVQVVHLVDHNGESTDGQRGDFCVDAYQEAVSGCNQESSGVMTVRAAGEGILVVAGDEECDGCAETSVDGESTGLVCGPGLGVPEDGGP
ncbi:MAG: hypothetical protein ACI9OJ_000253 [Myxococcota bacterium]|jgi:hypothetical protein